jgi:uncharacterized protein YycO
MVNIGPLSAEPWPNEIPGRYEPGRYVCVRTKGWVSRLIQLATLSPYDHTFMIVSDDGDIIEAEPGGARRANIAEYAGCRAVINTDPMDAEQQAKVVAQALAMIGVPYNDLGFVEDGLEAIGHPFKWLLRRAASSHGVICSQLAARAGTAAGYDWRCGKLGDSQVTPALLSQRPGMVPLTIG